MKRNSRGFTLIELLVVVAIIALLVSILLPSLARARELARNSMCLSNTRSMVTAMNMYATDSNGYYPFAERCVVLPTTAAPADPGNYAANNAANALPKPPASNPTVGTVYDSDPESGNSWAWSLYRQKALGKEMFLCPSHLPDNAGIKRSYAVNGNICPGQMKVTNYNQTTGVVGGWDEGRPYTVRNIKDPHTALLGEEWYMDGAMKPGGTFLGIGGTNGALPVLVLVGRHSSNASSAKLSTAMTFTHANHVNIGYVDSSAGGITVKDTNGYGWEYTFTGSKGKSGTNSAMVGWYPNADGTTGPMTWGNWDGGNGASFGFSIWSTQLGD